MVIVCIERRNRIWKREFCRGNKKSLNYADIIEVDVRKTKDGVLVLTHNSRLGNLMKNFLLEEALEITTKKRMIMINIKDKKIEKDVVNVIKDFPNNKVIINSLQKDILLNFRKL